MLAPGPRSIIVSHQFLAQSGAPRVADDEHVRQVGEGHAVGHRAGEADLRAGGGLVGSDYPPGRGELLLEVRPLPVSVPVGLGGQELPHPVQVDPGRVVVELVGTAGETQLFTTGRRGPGSG
jgi:hypothetical protein